MSKMFDPTEEETAISPSPLRATMTDVIKSGIDVPAAKKVSPITLNKSVEFKFNVANVLFLKEYF